MLGLRIRPGPAGRKLAATLAFGWAAYPYTAYALESNSNDTLVAVLLVATLLVLARPAARGVIARPGHPDQVRPAGPRPDARHLPSRSSAHRPRDLRALAFGSDGLRCCMLWPAIDPGLHTFYDRTIAYQADRDSPFSIWGQVPSLEPLRIAILVGHRRCWRSPSPSGPRRRR